MNVFISIYLSKMDIFLNEVTVRVSIPYEGKPYEGFQC